MITHGEAGGGAMDENGRPLKVRITGDFGEFSRHMRLAQTTPMPRRPWYRRRLRWI